MSNYAKGNASITFDHDQTEFFTGFLKTVAPEAEKIMSETFEDIEREAKAEWPKRKPRRTYNKRTRIWTVKDESLDSWNKFRRGVRIDPDGSVVVFLKNIAPYAWAIKFGVDSENKDGRDIIRPQGKRVSQELLVKPLRKYSRKVVKALADDLMRRV